MKFKSTGDRTVDRALVGLDVPLTRPYVPRQDDPRIIGRSSTRDWGDRAPEPPPQQDQGGGGYVAKAVHFDGANASLINNALAATDGLNTLCVGWFKFAISQSTPSSASVWSVDPTGAYDGFQAYNNDGTSSIDIPCASSATKIDGSTTPNTWQCLMSRLTSGASGVRQFYANDASILSGGGDGSGASTFNGRAFYFGDDSFGDGAIFDVADFRLWAHTVLDLSVQANRRLFIGADGKPVDPAVAVAAIGSAGAVFFSGDKDTYAVNQGTGGAFTLTGALTNVSTSPSD